MHPTTSNSHTSTPPAGAGDRLVDLFHHRWAVPVLGELGVRRGCKFVTLVNATNASPASIRQTLDHLIRHGWVIPNPGYGHPLRPEYLLTTRGEALAPPCAALDQTLIRLDVRSLGLRKWSLPVLAFLSSGPARFRTIARDLYPVTDRALARTLADLAAIPLVARTLSPDHLATPWYAGAGASSQVCAVLNDIRVGLS